MQKTTMLNSRRRKTKTLNSAGEWYKAFRHVETLLIQGNVFIRPGPLLVCAIPPTNSGPGRIKNITFDE